ncbi:MAG: P1 family peptidase, partial [Ilumatobacteraceae bacterium]
MADSPSPAGSIADVPGIAVGHATAARRGWRTGTTVVL